MRKQKKMRLSTKISGLTAALSACATLLLGVVLIAMFTFFFSSQTREDITYYLGKTNEQFDAKVQFVQDGAIAVRHNTVLEDFFKRNHYNKEEVETQLTYCMDLFSDRNMVSQNAPFAISVYLFNQKGDYVRKHYYPATLSDMERADTAYQAMQERYQADGSQFRCYLDGDYAALCFPLFDGEMKKMGTCIVTIQLTAVHTIFSDTAKYQNYAWIVCTNDTVLAQQGSPETCAGLSGLPQSRQGECRFNGRRFLCSASTSGFMIKSAVCVSYGNIYTVLKPTLLAFVLVLILILLLVSFIVPAVTFRTLRPLKEMADEISAFGGDNLHARMTDFPVQEFHDISFVFNEMADRIDHLITEVYEKELLATRAQVKYLQAQINPHFQFNILAMLSVKAKLAGNEELYQSLQAFSKLIQGKIFRDKEIKIPLHSEMELVSFYLFLQKERYQDKLSYEIRYGDNAVKNDMIPRLLIEPLVENAVSHGLEPKIGAGQIHIDLFEEAEKLHIVVADDGVGFDPNERPRSTKEGHTSTSFANTERLLQILYHDQYSIHIDGRKGTGTRVEVVLPIEREDSYVDSHGG